MANKTAVKDQLQDFGQKLGGARKDRVLSAERVISDDQIGNMTLSEIWPKSEVDDIEGIDVAAMATAVRARLLRSTYWSMDASRRSGPRSPSPRISTVTLWPRLRNDKRIGRPGQSLVITRKRPGTLLKGKMSRNG
jgi:hypothetical protein